MSRVRPLLAGFLGGAFLLPFLLTSCSGGASSRPPAPTAGGVVSLPSQVNSQGEVQVAVDGKFRPGEPVELGVCMRAVYWGWSLCQYIFSSLSMSSAGVEL